MLLSIQFPLADSRRFLDRDAGLLGRPNWPAVIRDDDFVRSFGMIRQRKRGGIKGWVGENDVCEAGRALRFTGLPTFVDAESGVRLPLQLAFRRFYFDGYAVGKFEVGIATRDHDLGTLSRKQTEKLVYHFLRLPVTIPDTKGGTRSVELARAGKHLASLYLASTVSTSNAVSSNPQDWWVKSGSPLLFIVTKPSENVVMPFWGKSVPIDDSWNFDLSVHSVPYSGKNVRMWTTHLRNDGNSVHARDLRISLMRLHAEHTCLELMLQHLATNRIDVKPRSTSSNALQSYLNEATKRISRLAIESNSLSDSDVSDLARESEDFIDPGNRESLLANLKAIDVRKNIFYKITDYVDKGISINVKELYMGDKNVVRANQIAAVGSNAHVHDFTQTWNQVGSEIDLKALASELSSLRSELKKEATEPEHDEAIGAIASAEKAAKEGDGPGVLTYLASAGKWALDVATKIGVSVATEALKKSIGMG